MSAGAIELALLLYVAGAATSTFGSMVGLGGGFLIVPVLRIFFGLDPAIAAGTSLAMVVANSASGAFTYLLQRRVHVRVGLLVAAGGFPGSILGALLVAHLNGFTFDWLYAAFLLTIATDVIVNRKRRLAGRKDDADLARVRGMRPWRALAAGFIVGIISSLFGVGGGVVLVPTFIYFSDLPAHAISATSHFGIVLTSPVGLATHAYQHDVKLSYVIPLVLGGLTGGPIGARLSLRLRSSRLLLLVAAALIVAGLSLLLRHFI